ncbi:uncharacterized [Tachysurus ichikawai]
MPLAAIPGPHLSCFRRLVGRWLVEYAWAGMTRSPRGLHHDSMMDEQARHYLGGGVFLGTKGSFLSTPDFIRANEGLMLMRDIPALGREFHSQEKESSDPPRVLQKQGEYYINFG